MAPSQPQKVTIAVRGPSRALAKGLLSPVRAGRPLQSDACLREHCDIATGSGSQIERTVMSDEVSRVVVGVDGSDGSISAARWAGAVANKFGTSLHLVHSLATTGQFIADAAVIAIRAATTADQHAAAEKVLAIAEQAVHEDATGLEMTTEVVRESADKALAELSQTARLVVVGCDDVNPAAALLMGSTSLAVATHAVCPVVVWRGVAVPNAKSVVVGVDGTPAGAAALAAAFEYSRPLQGVAQGGALLVDQPARWPSCNHPLPRRLERSRIRGMGAAHPRGGRGDHALSRRRCAIVCGTCQTGPSVDATTRRCAVGRRRKPSSQRADRGGAGLDELEPAAPQRGSRHGVSRPRGRRAQVVMLWNG